MERSLVALIALALSACSPPETPPAEEAGPSGADSTMVVATEARVPSDGRPVVVFLGTSLTAGLGLEREADTYVAALDSMATAEGLPFHAVNAGVSGETSAGGLRRLDWVLRTPLDVLFLELGANDGLRGHDPLSTADNLQRIVRQTQARYPEARVILAGMEAPPNLGERYTGAFRAVFTGVAESVGADLVPFVLDGVAGVPELNQPDRIHPTAEGHRRIAENVWPVLEPHLRALHAEGGS